jgi:hypothetical protein
VEYRERAGLNVAEASRKTKISDTKLRKLERGVNDAIRLADVLAFSVVYGCKSKESDHLIELVEAADSHGWYHAFDVDPEFAQYVELEGVATTINIYEQEFVNGLFQTPGYVDALRAGRPGTRGDADEGLRAQRQENTLGSDTPPVIEYVTSEAALRRQVGGPDVMRAQVRHLLELDKRKNVSISVVPFDVGVHPSMAGSYRILYFADAVFPTTVYLEPLHGSHYEDAGKIVGHYEEVFPRTQQVSTPIKEFIDAHDELA